MQGKVLYYESITTCALFSVTGCCPVYVLHISVQLPCNGTVLVDHSPAYICGMLFLCTYVQHLAVMKTTSDKVGQSLALKNVARALEYKGQIGKACEVWHEVRKLGSHKVRWSVSSDPCESRWHVIKGGIHCTKIGYWLVWVMFVTRIVNQLVSVGDFGHCWR